ncbi:MAG: PhoH family protein [Candidatus Competibacteraceae bacterium]|nr:PhoH family protein [Candidatus Competibacteraceae bacterium]
MSKKQSRGKGGKIQMPPTNELIIKAKNLGQKEVLRCIAEHDISIIYGPAGSGKTYLAVAWGLQQFVLGRYKRIIFTRPCIEAYGENLGFLPGGFDEKIAPYMIPIMDVLKEYISLSLLQEYVASGTIITLPLSFQRGVTFKDAYVVLDEAQNALPQQFKMFLTRMGGNSKIVVTGDPNQSDRGRKNGITDAVERLKDVDGIGMVELKREHIVRHPLVDIVDKKYADLDDK